jgi:hypothetical protein
VLYEDYVNLMSDLQIVALQTDATRVITMMMGREGSMRTYPEIGVPDPHHPLTHHRGNAEWIEKVTTINAMHMALVRRLREEDEGDPRRRRHAPRSRDRRLRQRPQRWQPAHAQRSAVALIGRGGGLRPGRHVVYPADTPMTNLYLTLLDRVGVHPEELGDSTGRVEHVTEI